MVAIPSATSNYDANDHLTSDTYDANGNTTIGQGKTYNYNFENRLTQATDINGAVSYQYDGDGNRVGKTAGGVTTNYLVDTNNLTGYAQVVEEIQSGVVTKQFTYGLDLISQRQAASSTTHYYDHDGNGNVRYLTATNGTISDTYTYEAFGTVIASTGTTPNDYRYSGEQYDPNLGFTYLRARYLNPNTGRFLTRDSFAGNVFDPPSLHRYTYCANDPVNHVDPSGREFTVSTTLTALTLALVLVVLDILIVAQTSVNYQKYFGLSPQDRAKAQTQNQMALASLKKIIESEGERTFQDENIVVGGKMGVKLPGNSSFTKAANLFESLRNVEGYPSALEELFSRIANRGFSEIPDEFAQTPGQRVELAKALLHRQEAFDRWLKRDY